MRSRTQSAAQLPQHRFVAGLVPAPGFSFPAASFYEFSDDGLGEENALVFYGVARLWGSCRASFR